MIPVTTPFETVAVAEAPEPVLLVIVTAGGDVYPPPPVKLMSQAGGVQTGSWEEVVKTYPLGVLVDRLAQEKAAG